MGWDEPIFRGVWFRGEWDGLVLREKYSSQIRDQLIRPKPADKLVPPGTSERRDDATRALALLALRRQRQKKAWATAAGSLTAEDGLGDDDGLVDGGGDRLGSGGGDRLGQQRQAPRRRLGSGGAGSCGGEGGSAGSDYREGSGDGGSAAADPIIGRAAPMEDGSDDDGRLGGGSGDRLGSGGVEGLGGVGSCGGEDGGGGFDDGEGCADGSGGGPTVRRRPRSSRRRCRRRHHRRIVSLRDRTSVAEMEVRAEAAAAMVVANGVVSGGKRRPSHPSLIPSNKQKNWDRPIL
uniref:Uncharacterized protein n=1 Tax=Oryza meridionalis TaxID=40149 RepID=A0A0E0CAG5_9ORYZ